MEVEIRQRMVVEAVGDWAEVHRVLRHGDKLYVELRQTSDAREPTIMAAVNEALDRYEAGDGKKEGQEDDQEENHCQREEE